MSTRCQIKVEGEEVMLYKHCDGYPSNILPELGEVLSKFKQSRGFFDGSYLVARIGQHFMNASDASLNGMLPGYNSTGFGYDTVEHADIKFLYTVHKNWTISVERRQS